MTPNPQATILGDPSVTPLFARVVEGAVGFAIAGSIIGLTLSGRIAWLPLGDPASLFSAGLCLGLVLGIGFGVAERLSESHHPLKSVTLTLVGFTPLGLVAASYGVATLRGGSDLAFAATLPGMLTHEGSWRAASLALLLALGILGPLMRARRLGQPRRQQSGAMALGGLVVFLLVTAAGTLPWPRFLFHTTYRLSLFRPPRHVPWFEAFHAPNYRLMLLCLSPAFFVPPCLGLGAWCAGVALRAFKQGPPSPTSTASSGLSLGSRFRGLTQRLALQIEHERLPPGPRIRARLVALTEDAGLLQTTTLVLLAGSLAAFVLSTRDQTAAQTLDEVALSTPLANLVFALIVLVAGLIALRRERRWRFWPGLLLGSVSLVACVLFAHGVVGAALLVTACLLACLAGGAFPPVAIAFVVLAWPILPRTLALRAPFGAFLPLWDLASSAVGVGLLYVWLKGDEGLRSLLVCTAGGVGAAWVTCRWTQAVWPVRLDLFFAFEMIALLTGIVGVALSSWFARSWRGVITGLLLCGAAVLGTEHHLAGDLRETYSTRRLHQAAEAGDREAMLRLAQRFRSGREMALVYHGGGCDQQEAYAWLRRAAEAAHPEAMYRLAIRIEKGETPLPKREADLWFKRAEAAGHERALERARANQR